MRIEILSSSLDAQNAAWERAYETAIERNFFVSPHWGRAVAAGYGIKPRVMLFKFPEQQVLLPCFVNRKMHGILQGMRSMAPHHYGGFLSDRPLNPSLVESIAQQLSRQWLLHTMVVAASPRGAIAGWERYQANTFASHVLDLSEGYAPIWGRAFDDKQRNSIRKACRSGLNVRKDNSAQGVASFYRLYLMSSERWELKNPEPRGFFEALLDQSESSATLWLASKGSQDIAGIIIVNNGRDTAYYLAGASDADYWKYCPNNLLLSLSIEEACLRGFTQFDFLPSGRIPSVEKFKESFGAVQVQVAEYWLKGQLPALKWHLVEMCRRMSMSRQP